MLIMQGRSDTLPAYFPLLFPVFFASLWILISFGVSFCSGWSALARRFAKKSEPYGETRTAGPFFYTVYMRFWCHYSGVIRLTAASDALYLSAMFLFRVGHPPLQIQWSEIRLSRTRWVLRKYVVLTLGNEEQIRMRISERMARNLGVTDRIPTIAPVERWAQNGEPAGLSQPPPLQ